MSNFFLMDLPFVSTLNATLSNRSCISKRNMISFTCKASLASTKKSENFYQVLSLDSKNVGVDEIKRAYRSMALRYHPDVCPPSERDASAKVFVELQKAYETLSDPVMREKYDYRLGSIDSADGVGKDGERWHDRSMLSKEAWTNQLEGLMIRSNNRMTRKT